MYKHIVISNRIFLLIIR